MNKIKMEKQVLEHENRLETIPETINIVSSRIDDICNELSIQEEYYGNILIAVTEAVNNAMNHGNKNDKNKSVYFSHEQLPNGNLSFKIEDEGCGFNVNSLPDPTLPENLLKENGRGVFLMEHLSDEMNYTNNGRTVELIFFLK